MTNQNTLLGEMRGDIRPPKDIFISYSHNDGAYVGHLLEKLMEKKPQYRFWFDQNREDNPPAGKYNEVIFPAIESCQLLIAFLSRTYAEKVYCEKEFNRAIDKQKNIMLVCLDDVTEEMLGTKSYLFGYCAGQGAIGYHRGVQNMPEEEVLRDFLTSLPFQQMDAYYSDGTPAPRLQVSAYLLNDQKTHLEKQYHQDGNYLQMDGILPDLFPAIRKAEEDAGADEGAGDGGDGEEKPESDGEEVPVDENGAETASESHGKSGATEPGEARIPLAAYLEEQKKTEGFRHLFLTGEGGFGKTVSLLETCRYLHGQNEYAIYVPLKNLNKSIHLEDYIQENVYRGNMSQWRVIEAVMKRRSEGRPSLTLLLDGLNEIAADSADDFVNHLANIFLPGHPGTRIIMTSRSIPGERYGVLRREFQQLAFCYLDDGSVERYIAKCHLPPVRDSRMLGILRTPLMLTLYCHAETCKTEYEGQMSRNVVSFFERPDSVGKILHNYFQTQIFRAVMELTFPQVVHVVLMEYVLPCIGLAMVNKDTFHLTAELVSALVDAPTQRNARDNSSKARYFDWYAQRRLGAELGGIGSYNVEAANDAKRAIQRELAFLVQEGRNMFFTHQLFRDYFAAVFLALELRYLMEHRSEGCDLKGIFQQRRFSDDILLLVADVLDEGKFEPFREENVWICPKAVGEPDGMDEDFLDLFGVSEQKEEEGSVESLLELWRGRTDEGARNAVYHILQIMRLGRHGKLFSCDFSALDFRGCSLRGIRFSEYLSGRYYTSTFDGAWIDTECFVHHGHSSLIFAISEPRGGEFFTGDLDGTIYRWRLSESVPVKKYRITGQNIRRLTVNAGGDTLLILTPHELYRMEIEGGTVEKLTATHRYFADVRFGEGDVPEVSFDTAPMYWSPVVDGRVIGERKEPEHPGFSLISGCIRVSPDGSVCAHSDLYSLLRLSEIDWENHVLREVYPHWRLKELVSGTRIEDVCWHPSGDRLAVAYSHGVFEFAFDPDPAVGLKLLRHSILGDMVNALCYGKYGEDDCLIVCHGLYVTVFDRDFTVVREYPGQYLPKILETAQRDNRTYLLSKNGELKLLDEDLTVHSVRNLEHGFREFCFGHDEQSDFICVLGKSETGEPICKRYDYENDRYASLDANYELEFEKEDHTDKPYRHYKGRNKMISIHRHENRRREYENFQGIFIQNCSFRHVKGTITEPESIEMIKQNGGIVDD